jgi:hypothetical protein
MIVGDVTAPTPRCAVSSSEANCFMRAQPRKRGAVETITRTSSAAAGGLGPGRKDHRSKRNLSAHKQSVRYSI